ncbi:MAG: hypothetical protein KF763_02940 [Cyclobacteriaceae bacterium]|nr:hypothetical protein [Cyclobacteriaceae bacterium]
MKSLLFCFSILMLCHEVMCQDEGTLQRKARFEKPHSAGIQVAPLFRMGKADYSGGFSVLANYAVRVNRILRVGPAVSFSRFSFQNSLTDSYRKRDVKGNNLFQEAGGYEIYVVKLQGGDLNQLSAGFQFNFNLIPFQEEQKFNVHVGLQPYLLVSHRGAVAASYQIWYANTFPFDEPALWSGGDVTVNETAASPGRSNWDAETTTTGGILISTGIEFSLPENWNLFIYPVLRYTMPVSHIKTAEYPPLQTEGYKNARYPLVKESFSAVGVWMGINYRF